MVGSRETGNETYVTNLIRGLARLPGREDYLLYLAEDTRPGEKLASEVGLPVRRLRPGHPLLRIPLTMPLAAARDRLQLLHVNYHAPPLCPCPVVVTIHDISFRFFPEAFSPRDLVILSLLVPLSARRAKLVIAVSESTKADLIQQYAIPAEKIVVTPEAASEIFRPVSDPALVQSTLRRYHIEGPYLLGVGNLQPRKNLKRLIAAYAQLRRETAWPHRLVLVGQKAWRNQTILEVIERAGLHRQVILTGYVTDEELPVLYSAADLFIYPSLYEGFGLPVLEAMACGTPVICANTSSLPEVAGEAAMLVDPLKVEELTQAMRLLLGDPARREALRQQGLARSRAFSWLETARLTRAAYDQALKLAS